ncbi:Phosphatidylserine decarboxylase proenzyme, partial [Bienertia sinuspersici]
NKPVKFLDTEVEKRLEIMKKLLVQKSGPTEGESEKQSGDKNGVNTSVTDEFVSILSEAHKEDPDVHRSINAARLVLLDEVKKRKSADPEMLESADEEMLEEKVKQDSIDRHTGKLSS